MTGNLAVCRKGLQLVKGRSEETCWWLAAYIRSWRQTLKKYALHPPSRNDVHYYPDNVWGVVEYILQCMFSHCLRLRACLALLSAFTRNKFGGGLDLFRYVAPKPPPMFSVFSLLHTGNHEMQISAKLGHRISAKFVGGL